MDEPGTQRLIVCSTFVLRFGSLHADVFSAVRPAVNITAKYVPNICENDHHLLSALFSHNSLETARQGYYEFDVDVSFYEIFDEMITDLLKPDNLASTHKHPRHPHASTTHAVVPIASTACNFSMKRFALQGG